MTNTKRSGFTLCSLWLVAVAAACSADDGFAEDLGSDADALGAMYAQYTYTPAAPQAGQPVSLDASSSRCNRSPCTYQWEDDGPDGPGGDQWPLGSGVRASFTFQGQGTKNVRLTVTNRRGAKASVVQAITIAAAGSNPPAPGSPDAGGGSDGGGTDGGGGMTPSGADPAWPTFPTVSGPTYYVNGASAAASDSNPGTAALPWKTIQRAATLLQPGWHVIVEAGTYNERVRFTRGGSASAGASIESVPARTAKTWGFDTTNAPYVRIKGFEIVPGSGAVGVRINSDNVQIGNNYIHDMAVGIDASPHANYAIYGNTIADATFGYDISGANVLVEGNEVNRIVPRSGYDDCDYSRIFGNDIVVRGNVHHGTDMAQISGTQCHVDDVQFFDNNGDWLRNVTFEKNVFADSHQGLMIESSVYDNSYNITVRNNVFTHNTTWGVCIKNNIDNWYIYNNTFVDTSFAGVGCEHINATNINVQNNIFVNMDRAYTGPGLGTYGNNLIYQTKESSAPSSTDVFGVSPGFVNVALRDFRLSAGSPAIDRGTSVGVTDDRFGTPRPRGAGFDIGMHEYAP